MILRLVTFQALLTAACSFAIVLPADPPQIVKKETAAPPPVLFPELKVENKNPDPIPVDSLPYGVIYPVITTGPAVVVDSPQNLVNITPGKKGPVTIGGVFVNGEGSFEIRDYTDKQYVYFVTAKKGQKGVVEIIVVTDLDNSKVFRRTLSVSGGKKVDPTDPTDPTDPVDPPPVDPTGSTSKPIVVICEDPIKRTPAQAAIINDDAFRLFIGSKGGQVEVLSIKDPAFIKQKYKGYADKAGLPTVLVFDGNATGATAPLSYFPLPGTSGDLIARVKKVTK